MKVSTKLAMTVKVDEDTLKAVNESVITTTNRVQSGMKTNKVAAETENPTKSTPASKPSTTSGVTKPKSSAFDEMKVRIYKKLQRMGKLMFIAGCCTLFIVILLGLTVIQIDRTSAFMYGFIWIGIHICGQVSNIMQVAAIRISIRKSSGAAK